jgi:hypothetical protein
MGEALTDGLRALSLAHPLAIIEEAGLERRDTSTSQTTLLTLGKFGDELVGNESAREQADAFVRNVPSDSGRTGIALVFAIPGSGKSFFMQHLCSHLPSNEFIVLPVTFNFRSTCLESERTDVGRAMALRVIFAHFVKHVDATWAEQFEKLRSRWLLLAQRPTLADALKLVSCDDRRVVLLVDEPAQAGVTAVVECLKVTLSVHPQLACIVSGLNPCDWEPTGLIPLIDQTSSDRPLKWLQLACNTDSVDSAARAEMLGVLKGVQADHVLDAVVPLACGHWRTLDTFKTALQTACLPGRRDSRSPVESLIADTLQAGEGYWRRMASLQQECGGAFRFILCCAVVQRKLTPSQKVAGRPVAHWRAQGFDLTAPNEIPSRSKKIIPVVSLLLACVWLDDEAEEEDDPVAHHVVQVLDRGQMRTFAAPDVMWSEFEQLVANWLRLWLLCWKETVADGEQVAHLIAPQRNGAKPSLFRGFNFVGKRARWQIKPPNALAALWRCDKLPLSATACTSEDETRLLHELVAGDVVLFGGNTAAFDVMLVVELLEGGAGCVLVQCKYSSIDATTKLDTRTIVKAANDLDTLFFPAPWAKALGITRANTLLAYTAERDSSMNTLPSLGIDLAVGDRKCMKDMFGPSFARMVYGRLHRSRPKVDST